MAYNYGLSLTNSGNSGDLVGAVLHLAEEQQIARNQAPRGTRLARTHFGKSAVKAALTSAICALVGCGASYRPVITAINPVGPAGQPQKFAVAISDPNLADTTGTLPGLVTFVDFSGDTVLITAGLGVRPQYLILGLGGGVGYTLNGDSTVNTFNISTSLLTSSVNRTTLLTTPANNLPTSIFPASAEIYITQPGRTSVAELTGNPPALQQEITGVGVAPTYIAGVANSPRVYALSPGSTAGSNGTASSIETTTNFASASLTVGVNPVYGVMTADTRRAFIMNKGSNTISVINSQTNQFDLGVTNGTIQDPAAVAPLWADFAPTLSELIVANEGDGTTAGSVSIFSIPLCNAGSLSSNPNCDTNNPIDAVGFGSLVANIPVGKNPLMVAALQDGTQAYVINQGDSTVSVINLTTNKVTATIPVLASPHPTFLAVTTGTPTGKVYVTSSTSTQMTVIRTDTNQVDTTIPLQGYGMQVRVTAP